MSLHNLATVFGPTLLRPSEVETKAHLTSAADIWSHDVMAQVPGAARPGAGVGRNTWGTPGLLVPIQPLLTERMNTGSFQVPAPSRPKLKV